MRKIEQALLNAVERHERFQLNNTSMSVQDTPNNGTKFKVFLHGNHIANLYYSGVFGKIVRVEFSFAGWQTSTTKSRINALFKLFAHPTPHCYQFKGELFVMANGISQQINAYDWYSFDGSICQKLAGV